MSPKPDLDRRDRRTQRNGHTGVSGRHPAKPPSTRPPGHKGGDQAERAIAYAESKVGTRYVLATAGPETHDCSGLTWAAARFAGLNPEYDLRSSHHQFNVWGEAVPDGAELARGDLLFFDTMGKVIMGNRASHVALHLGGGRFIHAANESLGVRYDDLRRDGWYWPRYIGARRVFSSESSEELGRQGRLIFPEGPIRTPTPWNGQPFGVSWSLVARWGALLEAAAARRNLDPRWLAVVMAIETQGIHERDGKVLEVWDNHPEDGPSLGGMQVKRVHQWLAPEADPETIEGNIELGAAKLRYEIDRHGSFEAAIAKGYHPGSSPNGTTPERYVRAARGLLGELSNAA